MVKIGDVVCHPNAGVCKVEDMVARDLPGMGTRDYYVLRPLYTTAATTVFTPVESDKIQLRVPMAREEVELVFARVPEETIPWELNDQRRHQQFSDILHSADAVQNIRMIVLLQQEEQRRKAMGKHLRAMDKKYLEETKRLLHQEVAYAMGLELPQVAPYIMAQLGVG